MSTAERPDKLTVGRLGEDAAAAYYEQQGYAVVGKNLRFSHRELDLVLENEASIVFAEVKTRRQTFGEPSPFGRPAMAVGREKKRNTVLAAEAYLRAHPTKKQPRIDVVEVYIAYRGSTPVVQDVVCIRNAFGK
ncbi:MAG: YraN family protein [Clostridia bacterium]|nr:YraN family protein [Clostridia bacterium]MBQ7315702.1 YraN family protein [Clostridia bacterium]